LFLIPAMSNKNAKPERPWQEIAAEAAREHNPEKLLELSNELALALSQRRKILNSAANPGGSGSEKKAS
jgi:hypothetical protein